MQQTHHPFIHFPSPGGFISDSNTTQKKTELYVNEYHIVLFYPCTMLRENILSMET